MEFITTLITQFNEYSKVNPVLTGVVSLWGVGVLTFLARNVPSNLWQFAKSQLTTTLTIDNQEVGNNYEAFTSFLAWLNSSKWISFSRSISVDGRYTSADRSGIVVGIGVGRHIFRSDGKFFMVFRQPLQQQAGGTKMHSSITITCLGRDRKL